MKKILFGAAGAVIIAASVYFGISASSKSDPMADLLMANVEALAGGEVHVECCLTLFGPCTLSNGAAYNGPALCVHIDR
ncbi:MAG: NVEALA domain-containing protein [Rikenellaceae bacterium]|jgi:hypothetical protein|nr:NVEALA domain-containing protein [Rikenellaceae bacterium]